MLPCRACDSFTVGRFARMCLEGSHKLDSGLGRMCMRASRRSAPFHCLALCSTAWHACSAAVHLIGPLRTVAWAGRSIDPTLSGRCRSTALPPMLELRESSAMCASTCVPCMCACVCLRVHVCVCASACACVRLPQCPCNRQVLTCALWEQVSEGVKQTVAQVGLSEMDVGALKDSISVRTTAAVSAVSDYW